MSDPTMQRRPIRGTGGARNGAKVTAMLGLMALVTMGCVYFYDVERNIHARQTLRRSCAALETRYRGAFASWNALPSAQRAHASREVLENLRADCGAVDAHLDTWSWNIRRDIELPNNDLHRARALQILGDIAAACPSMPRDVRVSLHQMFADGRRVDGAGAYVQTPLPASEADACESLRTSLATPPSSRAKMSAWDWASQWASLEATLSRP